MIPKRFRGISKQEIVDIVRRGRVIRFSGGVVRWRRRPVNAQHSRFAVSVSVRVGKRATERVKIRRAIHAALNEILPSSRSKSDIVIVWNRGAAKPNVHQLAEELRRIILSIR